MITMIMMMTMFPLLSCRHVYVHMYIRIRHQKCNRIIIFIENILKVLLLQQWHISSCLYLNCIPGGMVGDVIWLHTFYKWRINGCTHSVLTLLNNIILLFSGQFLVYTAAFILVSVHVPITLALYSGYISFFSFTHCSEVRQ